MPVPGWLGDYGDLSRRLVRLGHIALFGLSFTNLLLVRELPSAVRSSGLRVVAARAMSFGNVFLPTCLFAAAGFHPLKYLLPIPATAVAVALSIAAWGGGRDPGTDR